jgi:hypothetical protein
VATAATPANSLPPSPHSRLLPLPLQHPLCGTLCTASALGLHPCCPPPAASGFSVSRVPFSSRGATGGGERKSAADSDGCVSDGLAMHAVPQHALTGLHRTPALFWDGTLSKRHAGRILPPLAAVRHGHTVGSGACCRRLGAEHRGTQLQAIPSEPAGSVSAADDIARPWRVAVNWWALQDPPLCCTYPPTGHNPPLTMPSLGSGCCPRKACSGFRCWVWLRSATCPPDRAAHCSTQRPLAYQATGVGVHLGGVM